MNSSSRAKNSVRNTLYGFVNRVLLILLPFINRTIFFYTLGSLYLGLNSLFSSLLQMLSLSELGIGSALVFSMYKPLAEGDINKTSALLLLYKKVYRVIGLILLLVGFLIIPFLRYFISGEIPEDVNLVIVYIVFLVNTAISYFAFAHLKALLIADQRNDIVVNINSIITVLTFLFQTIILLVFKNYYAYILLFPLFTLLDNLLAGYIARRRYPTIQCKGVIPKQELKTIFTHVKGIAIQKICSTTRSSIGNIIVSTFLGLTVLAIYNNYYFIIISIHALAYQIPNAIRSSVGNSISSESQEKNYTDFNCLNFLYSFITGWMAICIFCLIQPFMALWMGEEMMLPLQSVALFALYFILLQTTDIFELYKDAAGLWWYGRYRAIAEVLVTIVLTLVLGKIWGVDGVLLAVIVSISIIGHLYGGYIVYQNYFTEKRFRDYIINLLYYLISIIIAGFFTFIICERIQLVGVLGLIIRGISCLLISGSLLLLLYRFNPYYKISIVFVKSIFAITKKHS